MSSTRRKDVMITPLPNGEQPSRLPASAAVLGYRPALETRPPSADDPRFPPAEQALARSIARKRETEPLAGPMVGARLFYDKLIKTLQADPRGVRAELMLGVPALLAGFACQAATWESLVVSTGYRVTDVFRLAGTADGAQYPFSGPMNQLLLEDRFSVWRFVEAAAKAKTDQPLPNILEIVTHVVDSIGTPQFGKPRMPEGFTLGEEALPILRTLWPRFLPLLGLSCSIPEEWPALFAISLQKAMEAVRELIGPVDACTIIMECAVPAAHLPMVKPGA
jgi:hypothetical protein